MFSTILLALPLIAYSAPTTPSLLFASREDTIEGQKCTTTIWYNNLILEKKANVAKFYQEMECFSVTGDSLISCLTSTVKTDETGALYLTTIWGDGIGNDNPRVAGCPEAELTLQSFNAFFGLNNIQMKKFENGEITFEEIVAARTISGEAVSLIEELKDVEAAEDARDTLFVEDVKETQETKESVIVVETKPRSSRIPKPSRRVRNARPRKDEKPKETESEKKIWKAPATPFGFGSRTPRDVSQRMVKLSKTGI